MITAVLVLGAMVGGYLQTRKQHNAALLQERLSEHDTTTVQEEPLLLIPSVASSSQITGSSTVNAPLLRQCLRMVVSGVYSTTCKK
jgi:hypothetical protein